MAQKMLMSVFFVVTRKNVCDKINSKISLKKNHAVISNRGIDVDNNDISIKQQKNQEETLL
jgi:hypothetical protein